MNITQEPVVQGTITDLSYNTSEYSRTFTYTLEIEKNILHVYDYNKEPGTSFNSLVSSASYDLVSHFKSSNNIKINKIICYTESTDEDVDILDIQTYDVNLEEYTGYIDDELYSLYISNKKIGVF
ncbi:hypothetical protein V5785_01075 [Bacillus subtilis]|uniref:hypothetical protein n=1 Tax=Bacillus subtilis TaxID=1423 RepID=UPI002FDB1F0D